jgi:hypothetical protein
MRMLLLTRKINPAFDDTCRRQFLLPVAPADFVTFPTLKEDTAIDKDAKGLRG